MITQQDIEIIDKRIKNLDLLVGSSNIVVDQKNEEVQRKTLYSRLNEIVNIRKILIDKDQHKPISEFISLYSTIPEVVDNFSSYARTLESVVDESRFILSISKQIQDFITLVKKVKDDSESVNNINPTKIKENQGEIEKAYQDCEPLMLKNKECVDVVNKLLQQYNEFITILNKRMIYLDHLITQKEKEKAA